MKGTTVSCFAIKAGSVELLQQYRTLFSAFCSVRAQNDPVCLLISVCWHCVNPSTSGASLIAAIPAAVKAT